MTGCATRPAQQAEAPKPEPEAPKVVVLEPPQAPEPPAADLPKQELTGQLLYEFLLAEVAGQRGNAVLAAQAYADLASRTKDPRIAKRAYEVAVAARVPDAAITSAKVWLDADPQSSDALRRLTALLVSTQRIEEARPHLQRMFSDPQFNRAEAFLQVNRLLAGNVDRAASLRVVQELAAQHSQLPEAHFAVAQAALQADQPALALQEIREALKLKPDWELGALLEAQLLQQTESVDAARDRLGEFLKTAPNSPDVRLTYARLLVGAKRYAEARTEFEVLLKSNPNNSDVLFAAALLSIQLQDYPAGEEYLKRLLDSDYRDKEVAYLYLGQIAEEQKRYDEALGYYANIMSNENFVQAQVRQAKVMVKRGDMPGARAFLQNVNASSNQQRVQLISAEADLLRDAGQVQEAFDVLAKGLEKLPNDPDLLYDYAMTAEKLDRVDVLESSLRKLIKIKPEHAHAYNALGYSLADRNVRLNEAYELIDKALKLAPEDVFIMDSMGWVLYRQGNNEEALKHLQRAYSQRQDPEIAAHLGEVLWAMGRKDEARKVWQEARDKAPSNETLQKTVQRFQP